ncbi:fibronectin type-III domain-containing protein 3A-like [Babylonia areolata]|uniref:fibronectin type-III domain-containing protein 3A-like n=1 Tax=Babylonia areolata TaxID=304850 RepID=UPI003FCFD611
MSDERTVRQRDRVRKKIQQRQSSEGTENIHCASDAQARGDPQDSAKSGEDNSQIIQLLSNIKPPQVKSVESRCAVIKLFPPDWESCEAKVNPEECRYELLLSDKGKDAKYKPVFCGDATEITLTDLKPGLEYHVRASAFLSKDLKGDLTDPVNYRTLSSRPDAPQLPKLMNRTKASLKLKWNAACDNGAKITAYCLEWDKGEGGGWFEEVYSGLVRQYDASHLSPSTCYLFRLAAVNHVGKSEWSETATFYTCGSVPPQPDPPSLVETCVDSVVLSWAKRPGDEEFLLQMEDETTGHGFIPVYNGSNLSCSLKELRCNTQYKFRLAVKNEEGISKWSEVVTFGTVPGVPAAPSRPQVKGRVTAHTFALTWDCPKDDGGADITMYVLELDGGHGYEAVYRGNGREHQCEGLTPGHQYQARVACLSAGGQSQFSDSCAVTTESVVPGLCSSPKLLGKPRSTSLHLRWSQPLNDGGSPVTQFAVQMISPDQSRREAYRGPGRDCVVAGLMPGQLYLFQVRAFNKVGGGPWSEPLEVTSGAAAPDAPPTPQVTPHSPHLVTVTWEEPPGNGAPVSEYRLEWDREQDGVEFSQLYSGPKLSHEAKGLTPATTYAFRVQAVNAAGPGHFSPTRICRTPPSSPGPVTSLQWRPLGPTSVALSWQPAPSNGSEVTSYKVSVSDRPVVSVGPVSECTLDDLLPDTTYRVQIQAVNSVGAGPNSVVTKVTTRPLPPPAPCLECVSTTYGSAKLKWGDGRNPHMLTYTLEMARDGANFQVVYTGSAHSHKVSRLTENTVYRFRVLATNDSGDGPFCDPVTLTTPRAPPPAVKTLTVTDVDNTSCTVQWAPCQSHHDDDALTYVLQILLPQSSEFRQVYRGPNTHHSLHGLQPGTHHQLRAFAVRQASDGTSGPFSPLVHFTTTSPTSLSPTTTTDRHSQGSGDSGSGTQDHPAWTDEQWAAVILLVFVVTAVVVAVVVQQLVARLGGSSPPVPPPPSSPNHSSPGAGTS